MFGKIKDNALSKGTQIAINNQIKEYGKMLKLNLDSKTKSIEMEVMLDGEVEPLSIHVKKYEIMQESDRYFLKVNDITTSRAWINTIVASYLEGKRFEIPAEYAKLLKVVV